MCITLNELSDCFKWYFERELREKTIIYHTCMSLVAASLFVCFMASWIVPLLGMMLCPVQAGVIVCGIIFGIFWTTLICGMSGLFCHQYYFIHKHEFKSSDYKNKDYEKLEEEL